MNWDLLKAIIILPGSVLVLIPTTILLLTRNSKYAPELCGPKEFFFWLTILFGCTGVLLATWTVTLFMTFGEGTPAPWQPPKKLIVRGPYCFVRNPMITSVLLMLLAEALLFKSWPVAIWMLVFFAANAVYFPYVEEKKLEKRFGSEYLDYKAHVPRWVPRIKPWTPSSSR